MTAISSLILLRPHELGRRGHHVHDMFRAPRRLGVMRHIHRFIRRAPA